MIRKRDTVLRWINAEAVGRRCTRDMSTATPTRDSVSTGLRRFLTRMTSAGWDIEAPGVTAPRGADYCLIARSPDQPRGVSHLVYVYEGLREVHVEELWRLVSDTRLTGADRSVMCLGPHAILSPSARNTAALLKVRVLRLAE